MITTQRAALAAIRKHGYLNYFSPSPAESWYAVASEPGAEMTDLDQEVCGNAALRLIAAGKIRHEGSSERCAWYRCSPNRQQRRFTPNKPSEGL